MKQDSSCFVTTLVDYYALPKSGEKEWPGRIQAEAESYSNWARFIEEALRDDFSKREGNSASGRFIPFILVHEFEALCFADCDAFCEGIGRPDIAEAMKAIRDALNLRKKSMTVRTAPSKRIINLHPSYEKPVEGNIGILEISLESSRRMPTFFRLDQPS